MKDGWHIPGKSVLGSVFARLGFVQGINRSITMFEKRKIMLRPSLILVSLIGFVGTAHAKDVYIYDLLKQPAFAQSWKRLLTSERHVPAWLSDDDRFVASPAKDTSVGSTEYSISVVAKQHATSEGEAAILFTSDGKKAWAKIDEEGRKPRYLGIPSVEQKELLDKALEE